MPAPRCWVRVRVLSSRRVGRLLPVRIEPSGVVPSRDDTSVGEAAVPAAPVAPAASAGGAAEPRPRSAEASGEPQTLQ